MQKRLFDIGWSDESNCQACHKENTGLKGLRQQKIDQLLTNILIARSVEKLIFS